MSADPTRIDIALDPRALRMKGIATHGMTPFDVPYISHVEGNLWQGGCDPDMTLPSEIKHLVSLYKWARYKVRHELLSDNTFLMHDAEDQGFEQVEEIAKLVVECCETAPTLVHCQAGLNRSGSGLIAARALMLQGRTADEAIALLRERRSPAVLCNHSFEDWLRSL